MGDAEKGLRVQRESAAKRIGEARSCGERNERQPAYPVVHAGGGFSGNVGNGAESAIDMKGYLSIAAIHAEAAALAGVGIAAQIAVSETNFQWRRIRLCLAGR